MSQAVTDLDQIDLDISLAYAALGVARVAQARSPSAENGLLVDRAESELDRLLDLRIAARR